VPSSSFFSKDVITHAASPAGRLGDGQGHGLPTLDRPVEVRGKGTFKAELVTRRCASDTSTAVCNAT
jgi:hypothetical protein